LILHLAAAGPKLVAAIVSGDARVHCECNQSAGIAGSKDKTSDPATTEATMARLTGQAVKTLAQQLYDYDLSDDAADAVAHMVGAMATYSRRLEALSLNGLQPPFGYPILLAEAERRHRVSK
jgi:hypothetical protein